MADEQDSLLRQIDEEIRREKLAKLWDQYGVMALGGVAVVLLAFAGWKFYQSETIRSARQAGAQFAEISELLAKSDKKSQTEAVQALETLTQKGGGAYPTLANFKLAARARAAGQPDEAIKHYQKILDATGVDPKFRSFAKLQIASLKLDAGNFTEAKNQLNDLAKEDSPWRFTARELLGLAALKSGDFKLARETFQSLLTATDAPRTLAQRAQIALAMVARDEAKSKAPSDADRSNVASPATGTPDAAQPATKSSGSETPKPDMTGAAATKDTKPTTGKPETRTAPSKAKQGAATPPNETTQ